MQYKIKHAAAGVKKDRWTSRNLVNTLKKRKAELVDWIVVLYTNVSTGDETVRSICYIASNRNADRLHPIHQLTIAETFAAVYSFGSTVYYG